MYNWVPNQIHRNDLFDLQPDKSSGTIKEQLSAVAPALEQLWKQKDKRIKEFSKIQSQIQTIYGEIAGTAEHVGNPAVDESDLSLTKLEELRAQLQELQNEKVKSLMNDLVCARGARKRIIVPSFFLFGRVRG